MRIFVIGSHREPLMPCHPARARELLREGRAVVHRRYPFTIRLKDREDGIRQPIRLKLDPGSRTTGLALVREAANGTQHALWLAELEHRGSAIRERLATRRAFRRRRRSTLRHRPARFNNRRRPEGWLAPSLRHRVDTTMTWVARLRRLAPVTGLSQELVRFDTQAMQNPEIAGVEYQQGTLAGYEVREYLLEKWSRQCAYCGKKNLPLEVDHIDPKSRGGSDRVSNLTLACHECNQDKGNRDIREFLANHPDRLMAVLAKAQTPLHDAAAINSTRWALFERLKDTDLPVETATGGRTKWNRNRLNIPKTHCLDAACVGDLDRLLGWNVPVLGVKAAGRGSYQRTRLMKDGFPRGYLTRSKRHCGFQTGDLVRASVPRGKKAGIHIGRVAVRASGSFNIQTLHGVVQGISHRRCSLIQRADGYGYAIKPKIAERKDVGTGAACSRRAIPPRHECQGSPAQKRWSLGQ
ncbi:RNA-guided endonuclease IscB [Verrucomicrobium sp. 3C]|uniref:RNA-guided endonuclease IscB n=1 Tax=Verrucomicrobium sp. 3C TaxID=1134055 RepID=UPI0012DC5674|nr:RNA-guided endonuclease IscB [Verrucomicrobium sp. 3C]